MNIKKGFTLIELMITVTIVGVLTALAVPAYQDYTIKSQVTEGLALASGSKTAVSEYYQMYGKYPDTMSDIGMNSSVGNYIKETQLGEDGEIIAIFGEKSNKIIHNKYISLISTETDEGNLKWDCQSDIPSKYLPNSCINLPSNDTGNDNDDDTDTNGDYWKDFSPYMGGILVYNGDGTITNSNGDIISGSIVDGEILFNLSDLGIGLNGEAKIDKDGKLITLEDYGTYTLTKTHINYGFQNESIDSYNFPDIDGKSYTLDNISYFLATNYHNSDLFDKLNKSTNDFINSAKNGIVTPDLLEQYNNDKNNYINYLKTQKENGVRLSPLDNEYINLKK